MLLDLLTLFVVLMMMAPLFRAGQKRQLLRQFVNVLNFFYLFRCNKKMYGVPGRVLWKVNGFLKKTKTLPLQVPLRQSFDTGMERDSYFKHKCTVMQTCLEVAFVRNNE